jgi:hypothetical protein
VTHVYLRKANDDFCSHCRCEPDDALVSSPGQMDCPWCGCGSLFICSCCHKAFTFAEGVEVEGSWEATADRNIRAKYGKSPEPGEVEEWIGFMKILLKEVEPGSVYVYFDGYVVPTTATGIAIDGWYARHDLDFVPQVAAMGDPAVSDELLWSREYWQANRIPRQDG